MSGGSVDAVTTVAVVEDDTDILAAVIRGLTERGHVVLGASTGLGALGEIVEQRPDVVVLDLGLARHGVPLRIVHQPQTPGRITAPRRSLRRPFGRVRVAGAM